MSVDRNRVKEIFFEALDRPPEKQRVYLDEACGGDDALRAEVQSLLAHHDDAPLVEGDPGAAVASTAPTLALRPRPVTPAELRSDRYRELGEVGAGGFGVVARHFDRSLRRVVACKSPRIAETAHETALLREARLLAYLDHPGVVQVYDLREDLAGVSYTMQLLDGESVSQRLEDLRTQRRPMAVSEALRIVTRVSETVANAHSKGVLHLDLKPDNVMLQPFGHVSVIDWGMARFYDPEPYRQHLARAGELPVDDLRGAGLSGGTPAYMPPEQFDSAAELSRAADIYAIGAVLFELLAGRCPFDERDDMARLLSDKTGSVPSLREARHGISERLDAICARMLAPEPADRPESLGDVLEDLAALSDVGRGTELVHLEPGQVLFEQGADSTTAYQILAGELEIVVRDEVVATRRAGDIVGELAMLSRARRSATVRAGPATVVRAIDWGALEDELSKVDPLVGHLLRKLSDKLIETTRS